MQWSGRPRICRRVEHNSQEVLGSLPCENSFLSGRRHGEAPLTSGVGRNSAVAPAPSKAIGCNPAVAPVPCTGLIPCASRSVEEGRHGNSSMVCAELLGATRAKATATVHARTYSDRLHARGEDDSTAGWVHMGAGAGLRCRNVAFSLGGGRRGVQGVWQPAKCQPSPLATQRPI